MERERLAREEDEIGGLVDPGDRLVVVGRRRHDLHAGGPGQAQRRGDVVGADGRGADEPDPGARRQCRDLVDEVEVAGADQHRHDRHPAGRPGLRLVGVERRRRDQVVVEALEPLVDLLEERALGVDRPREGLGDPLGVVAGVGLRAFGEQDLDERAGALPLGGRGERRRRDLVRGEAGGGRPTEHLVDDPGQRLGTAPLGWPVGDVGARAVPARDVAGVGQALVDGPDRVRVDPERGAELADRRQAGAGEQPTGVDLVGDLPVDLGRDRDVRVTLDIEVAGGRRSRASQRGQLGLGRDLWVT